MLRERRVKKQRHRASRDTVGGNRIRAVQSGLGLLG